MQVKLWSNSARTNFIFWTAIAVLIGASCIAVLNTYRLIAQYSAAMNSDQAVLGTTEFLSDLKDVETGARGYALTRDKRFLSPYDFGAANLRARIARLGALARADPELSLAIDQLDVEAGQRIVAAKQLIGLVSAGAKPSSIIATADDGKTAMDQVRLHVGAVISATQKLQDQRRQMLQQEAVRTSQVLALGSIVSLLMLSWLFIRRNEEVRRRRRVERELRELNAELEQRVEARTFEVRRANDLLNDVVENLPDMVFLKDSANGFRYLLINAAGERLLGRERSEILGKTDHDILSEEEAAQFQRDSEEAIEAGGAGRFSERTLSTAQGKRTVESRKIPLVNGDGDAPLVLGIVRDVTEQRSLETQLREMQRLDSVGRLTGGVAHDFNNLLAVIMGSIELVRERLPAGSESAEIADEALEAARRGAELVRRLLAFARKQHLEPTAVDLNDRLAGVVPLLQRSLGEKILIQVNPAKSLWHARIDPTQVDDALVNLAINSRDAMSNGGTLTIETANVILDDDYAAHHVEVEPGEYVMLAVSDTGTGMSADVAARAFEPFFTTKEEGRGTGLGLSQVFGWVKQSGGHIKVYSEVGHGTTIKLYLPRAGDGDGRLPEPPVNEISVGGQESILLVEDNPQVRRTAARQLSDLGYLVLEANDGQAALDMVRSGIFFDLLLTDVVMPGGISGYDLSVEIERLRPGTKVLFTSGYTELAAHGLPAARKGPVISKPYTKRDLGQAIRAVLQIQE